MPLDTLHEIERAINALPPQELVKLYAWLDQHHPPQVISRRPEQRFWNKG